MKLKIKRAGAGSSLDGGSDARMASSDSRASRMDLDAAAATSTGSLHRAYVGGYAPTPEFEELEPEMLRSGRSRLNFGFPKSLPGRLIAGTLLFFCVGSAAALVYVTRSYLLHDERFVIPASANIEINGNQHMTRAQLLSVFGADVERSIFRVPLGERRADLENLPWVDHATVMRLLPNRIRVQVTERTPVAFVRQGTNIGLVDANGVLLDMPAESAGDPRYSFPVLTGLEQDAPLSTRAARMEVYQQFVHALDSSGEKLSDKVSEVDVSNPEDVKAMVAADGSDVLVHFGDEDFLGRFRHFEQHLPEWRQQYPKLASADMRYERQVVLEMQPGAGIPTTPQPAASDEDSASGTQPAAAKSVPTKVAATNVASSKPAGAKPVTKPASPKPVNSKLVHPPVAVAAPPAPAVLRPGHMSTTPDAGVTP